MAPMMTGRLDKKKQQKTATTACECFLKQKSQSFFSLLCGVSSVIVRSDQVETNTSIPDPRQPKLLLSLWQVLLLMGSILLLVMSVAACVMFFIIRRRRSYEELVS